MHGVLLRVCRDAGGAPQLLRTDIPAVVGEVCSLGHTDGHLWKLPARCEAKCSVNGRGGQSSHVHTHSRRMQMRFVSRANTSVAVKSDEWRRGRQATNPPACPPLLPLLRLLHGRRARTRKRADRLVPRRPRSNIIAR